MENGLKYVGDLLDSLKGDFLSQPDNESTGFNVFKALGIDYREVYVCRFLGALLEPNGAHGMGTKPLQLFLKMVLNVSPSIENASVTLEELIENDRRVDIVIRNGGKTYPIEAKIGAGDQDAQLYDYYKHYFKENEDEKIWYLTPDRRKPSAKSVTKILKENLCEELPEKNIACISFTMEIKSWLDELQKKETTRSKGIAEIIQQFQEVIVEMCAKATEIDAVFKVLGWPDKETFVLNEQTETLIRLLALNGGKNGELQKQIQIAYLKQYIKFDPEKYEYVDEPEAEKKKAIDSHALLYIGKRDSGNNPIAWICVDTNLYLACDNRDSDASGWHGNENWAYLNLDGKGKPLQMNDCLRLLEKGSNITIDSFLSDIIA